MTRRIEPIVMDVHLPAGIAGPAPLDFDVRCFLVAHATGIVVIDAGMAGSQDAIMAGLERMGAGWGDVTDVVLTHAHEDHSGGLAGVIAKAPHSDVWAGIADHAAIASDRALRPLIDDARVRDLRVMETPGHTPGHCSLVLDEASIVFAGDVAGSMGGVLSRGPAPFTADADEAEPSLGRIADLQSDRVLFGHGNEVDDPIRALRDLLGERPISSVL